MHTPSVPWIRAGAVAALLLASTAHAAGHTVAAGRQPNGAELVRAIERLSVVGNVMYLAAHPDDENTRLLAWLANEKLLRAGYLSLTRGEGGQNLIGPEQQPLLGLIRTNELLAARATDGAQQMFSRARDFGFSKNPEETLRIWNKDDILGDVVWNIRRFRPDVIITRFPPDGRDTHGHHTASAQLAVEAFKLAGDAKAFPEQLKWVKPWAPKRIYWNRGFFDGKPGDAELAGYVTLDVGGYNPVLGESYGEIAARSRSMHKSQGFGVAPGRGPVLEYFKLLDGGTGTGKGGTPKMFEGIDQSWSRVAGGGKVSELCKRARAEFKTEDPAASIPVLVEAYGALAAMPDNPWKEDKRAELANVIAACAGLFTEAFAADHVAVPGGELPVTAVAINRSNASITLREIRFINNAPITINKALMNNQPLQEVRKLAIPAELPPSNPYWLVEEPQPGHWTVDDQLLIGLPTEPAPLQVRFSFAFNNQQIDIDKPVEYKWTDPVAGERHRAIEILPPVTLAARSRLMMFSDAHKKELRVTVKSSAGAAKGVVRPVAPSHWTIEPPSLPFTLSKKDEEEELIFHVQPPLTKLDGGESASATATLQMVAELDGKKVSRALTHIDYPHIPIQTVVPPAEVKLVRLSLQRVKSKIGYVRGAGDDVPEALRQAGYEVTMLNDEALAEQPLARFDAIITGVRAFNVNPRLAHLHARLMDYVKSGGTLLVQYNTRNWLSDVPAEIGPYPFEIAQDRVTDETAAITLVGGSDGKSTILSAPNHLGPADFAGWVQERGLYFAGKWDSKYEAPLELHDPGESAKHGSLLIAKYGKGTFIYTGLAFFRQLPAGVPGAFRLFANLLAHGH